MRINTVALFPSWLKLFSLSLLDICLKKSLFLVCREFLSCMVVLSNAFTASIDIIIWLFFILTVNYVHWLLNVTIKIYIVFWYKSHLGHDVATILYIYAGFSLPFKKNVTWVCIHEGYWLAECPFLELSLLVVAGGSWLLPEWIWNPPPLFSGVWVRLVLFLSETFERI